MSTSRGNAFLRPDPEPEFRDRAPRGPRPTKTTTASRVELEDDDAVAGIRELHVVQRSNRNMLDSKQAYTVPRNSFFETEERGERGPVSPSRTSRLCIACYEEWKDDAFPASWNYPLFYSTDVDVLLPFEESFENFFHDTVFSDHPCIVYIPVGISTR